MYNHATEQQVFNLKHQAVRDLAWSIWGPSLLIQSEPYDENRDLFPLDWPWLQQLDKQPEILLVYLKSKNTRLLGTYFEALWHFYFSHHPRFTHCSFNVQVNSLGKTLGEFDILIIDPLGRYHHLELACKFYLHCFDSQQQVLWIGPNCGDRLDIKYHKTQNHQLPLLHSELGWLKAKQAFLSEDHQLASKETSHHIYQQAIWRGQAFSQHNYFHYKKDELDTILSKARNHKLWFIADKSYWLSPVVQDNQQRLLTRHQAKQFLDKHFLDEYSLSENVVEKHTLESQPKQGLDKQKKHTLMLVLMEFSAAHSQWQQCTRYFITPPNWPYGKLSTSASTPLLPCKPPL